MRNFLQGFASGALGSMGAAGFGKYLKNVANKALGQIAFGALSGAIGAEATGGEWWRGAIIGGMVAGLNHAMHDGLEGGDPKPKPKKLPGFEDAEPAKRLGGRPRWKLKNGDILEWDSQHGELERYDKTGKNHKGAWDTDGNQIKNPVPGRTTQTIIGVGAGAAIGAGIIKYGGALLRLLSTRIAMPILIMPGMVPNTDPYGFQSQKNL